VSLEVAAHRVAPMEVASPASRGFQTSPDVHPPRAHRRPPRGLDHPTGLRWVFALTLPAVMPEVFIDTTLGVASALVPRPRGALAECLRPSLSSGHLRSR